MTQTLTEAPSALPESNGHTVRLNLGAGDSHLAGFINIDRRTGQEAYPLSCPDSSVEEIFASHILEHFSHRDVGVVLKHWVDKLAPGGKIRLSVPDFERLAKDYLSGAPINIQGYVMGAHNDSDDRHGCIFDRESLTELMINCGLERIGFWHSNLPVTSSLPISLNLQGFKPFNATRSLSGVRACLSTPRFGPLIHPRCAERAFQQLAIRGQSGQSCFWHQKLSELIEDAIADSTCEYVLTLDFDTVFCASDVLELYRLLRACPEADAVFPLQSKRGCEQALFSLTDADGNLRSTVAAADLQRNLLPANTGHFGLTLFRAASLRRFPRPWMVPVPNERGLWRDGHVDADINFWQRFQAAGFRCFLAPKVVVGHLEEIVKWPGPNLSPVYQSTADYDTDGIPAAAIR